MQTYWIVFLAVLAVSTGANAQSYFSDVVAIQTTNLSTAEKQYAACLRMENDGVVESALAHVAMLKLMYPVKELATVAREVRNLMKNNASAEIRYKAYVVNHLISNPKLFASEARTTYESPDELFGALAARLHDVVAGNMAK
jgi:hypothetical protein